MVSAGLLWVVSAALWIQQVWLLIVEWSRISRRKNRKKELNMTHLIPPCCSVGILLVAGLSLAACTGAYLAPGNAKLPPERLSISNAPDAATLQLAAPLPRADMLNINDPAAGERTLLGEVVADYARTPLDAVAPAGLKVKPGRPVHLHWVTTVKGTACGVARSFVFQPSQSYVISPFIRPEQPAAQACELRVTLAGTTTELPPNVDAFPKDPTCRI
ncbi:hypothetical protein [Roseateles sp. LYH14W]|uniref:hypothetical protein n=1 Tax=Pelomonas parva TaxID=3299032 RepID=UPI0037494801